MSIDVLIVDDHAVFRAGLKALLEREDDIQIVGEAGDGKQAMELARTIAFDVLLLDISMPGMSGPRVAEAVLEGKPGVAIVVLTMHEEESYLKEFFRIGVRGFVLKRSTGTDLLQAVRATARGGQYVDPSLTRLVVSSYLGHPHRENIGEPSGLTVRETEVLRLLALGHTNGEVAGQLNISVRTAESHRGSIMGKLGLTTRAELVRFAIDHGILKLE